MDANNCSARNEMVHLRWRTAISSTVWGFSQAFERAFHNKRKGDSFRAEHVWRDSV